MVSPRPTRQLSSGTLESCESLEKECRGWDPREPINRGHNGETGWAHARSTHAQLTGVSRLGFARLLPQRTGPFIWSSPPTCIVGTLTERRGAERDGCSGSKSPSRTQPVARLEPVLPAEIGDGRLRVGDFVHKNLVPLPFESQGPTSLRLELIGLSLQTVDVIGDGVRLAPTGEPRYVEDLPADLRPQTQ